MKAQLTLGRRTCDNASFDNGCRLPITLHCKIAGTQRALIFYLADSIKFNCCILDIVK